METEGYRKAVVSFFDILGFKALVGTHRDDPFFIKNIIRRAKERVILFQGVDLKEYTSSNEENELLSEKNRSYFFSDCIVLVQECTLENDFVFVKELSLMRIIQSSLASEGIFVRGGISYGDIFYDESTVFGPALIRAYELESCYADFPRVIVDGACKGPLERPFKWLLDNKKIARDGDGFYFLNYLEALTGEESSNLLILREKVRYCIENNIRENWKHERILRKYYWLADYYNKTFCFQGKEGNFIIDVDSLLKEEKEKDQKKDAG